MVEGPKLRNFKDDAYRPEINNLVKGRIDSNNDYNPGPGAAFTENFRFDMSAAAKNRAESG